MKRLVDEHGEFRLTRVNVPFHLRFDPYHLVLTIPWWQLVALYAGFFVVVNGLFAALYLLEPGCIANARPGSYVDAYFFSVQTISTIGYGTMVPQTAYANLLVSVESLVGLIAFAFFAGILFNKFALPTAKVMFSDRAVVTTQHKRPALVFRIANARNNQVVDARVRVTLIRTEVTPEGYEMRIPHELALERDRAALLLTTMLVIHRIDEASPLFGKTSEELAGEDAVVVVTFTGIDGTFSQIIHACHVYDVSRLVWGAEFASIETREKGGWRTVDYGTFHDIREL